MTFTPEQVQALEAPLDRSHVKERTQAGRKLSYVEGWHAIAEANRIFGFDAWTRQTIRLEETNRDLVELNGDRGPYKQWRVGYLAVVRVTVGEIVREGTGFGSGMGKPEALSDAIESAIKEAETDAMKRALMTFGNPFGLALYDKTQANVASDEPQRRPQRMSPGADDPGGSKDTAAQWAAWGRSEMAKFAEMDMIVLKAWNADNVKNGRLAKLERHAPDTYEEASAAYRERLSELTPNLRAAG